MPCPSCGRFRDDLKRKNSVKDADCKVVDKISDRRISVVSNEAREKMRYVKILKTQSCWKFHNRSLEQGFRSHIRSLFCLRNTIFVDTKNNT